MNIEINNLFHHTKEFHVWMAVCVSATTASIIDISDVTICWRERLTGRDIGNYTIRNCLPAWCMYMYGTTYI